MNIGPLTLQNLIWAYGAAPVHQTARECGLEIFGRQLRRANGFACTESEQSIFWDRCMKLAVRDGRMFG